MKRLIKKTWMASLLAVLILTVFGLALAENKSPMFSRQVPGGLFAVVDNTQTTGNIWFVDSGSANASDAAGYGQNPDAPFATIDYAIGNCTASNGDWIMVMPGHAESVSSAAYINADVAGVRIIGLGTGRNRPVLTWTAAAGEIKVNAADVTFENMVFNLTRTGGVRGGATLYSSATDTVFKDIEWVIPSADTALYLSGGTRTVIDGNTFRGSVATTSGVTQAVIYLGGGVNDVKIVNSTIAGYNLTAGTGLIQAASSRVSGFFLYDTDLTQFNTGASCWVFSTVGLSSNVSIKNVATHYNAGALLTAGGTVYNIWHALSGPPGANNQ